MSKKLTTEGFIAKAKTVHGERYEYKNANYVNTAAKLTITCFEHGKFEQAPNDHLGGHGCPMCGKLLCVESKRLTIEKFIKKANSIHDYRYTYTNAVYPRGRNSLNITCTIHGDFKQTPSHHLDGQGCPLCGLIKCTAANRSNTQTFINKAKLKHNDLYTYKNTRYPDSNKGVLLITCITHGDFEQRPNGHLNGNGCNKCKLTGLSKPQIALFDFVKSLINNTVLDDRKAICPLELDVYLPEHKVAIEHNGLLWHSEKFIDKKYHLNKLNKCREAGIDLIQIYEDEWLEKPEIVKSLIASRIGIYSHKTFARKTLVKTVGSSIAESFYSKNHIKGYIRCDQHYGLYEGEILLAMASFSKPRVIISKTNIGLEMVRFCNRINTQVVGGLGKLLKTVKGQSVLSYCDMRLFNGNSYQATGFVESHTSKPGYDYVKGQQRFSRFMFQKHKLEKLLPIFDADKTEVQNMNANHYRRIFDCGTRVFLLPALNNTLPARIKSIVID